jgi:hypothetical protein
MSKEKTILELLVIIQTALNNSKETYLTACDIYEIQYTKSNGINTTYYGICDLITILLCDVKKMNFKECKVIKNYLRQIKYPNPANQLKIDDYWFPEGRLQPRKDFINTIIKNYK